MEIAVNESRAAERGALRYAWFDGLLEGSCSDPDPVRAAIASLKALAPGSFSVSFEGSLCSLLAEPKILSGRALDGWSTAEFQRRLEEVIALLEPGSIESTLRRTEVFAQDAREIIFAINRGTVREISRDRPLNGNDLDRAPAQTENAASPAVMWRAAAVGLGLILVACLIAWQGGIIDRILASAGSALERSTGPFDGMLRFEVAQKWGDYEVTVKRGPDYPSTSEAVDRLLAKAVQTSERASVNVVAEGGVIYVHLEGAEHKLLASEPIDLRPLLSDANRTSACRLPGRMRATAITLALDKGEIKP